MAKAYAHWNTYTVISTLSRSLGSCSTCDNLATEGDAVNVRTSRVYTRREQL